jgi:hypothetical protein
MKPWNQEHYHYSTLPVTGLPELLLIPGVLFIYTISYIVE